MSPTIPSTLSMIAAAGYAVVVLSCLFACVTANTHQQRRSQIVGWALIAAFFALLIFLRVNMVEETLRDELRGALFARGEYESRRDFQVPLTVGIIVLATGFMAWLFWSYRQARGRRDLAYSLAKLGVFVMIVLIVLRSISLNALDKLLYGPLKLNWVGDIGSAALVLAAAIHYAVIVRQPKRTRSRAKGDAPPK